MKNSGISSNDKRTIEVYTDGSCMAKKTGTLCGYGVYFPNGEIPNMSRPFTKVPLTNQRSELYAIFKALRRIHKFDHDADVIIYTDSEYSIKSLTVWIKRWKENKWKSANNKPVMNTDIILKIDALMAKHNGKIKFIHVMAHTGGQDIQSINNDKVDALAKAGAFKSGDIN